MAAGLPVSVAQAVAGPSAANPPAATAGNGLGSAGSTAPAPPSRPAVASAASATPSSAPTPAADPAPAAAPPSPVLLQSRVLADNEALMARSAAIAVRLAAEQPGLQDRLQLAPGVEVRSDGDLRLGADFDLQPVAPRTGGQAMTLTLRAAGNLTLGYSLSDGFAQPTAGPGNAANAASLAQAGPAASYRLIAGADLAAADPLTTQSATSAGSLLIGRAPATATGATPTVLVRSTVGDIALAAAGDIRLLNNGVRITTTGTPLASAGLPGWDRVGLASNQTLRAGPGPLGPFFTGAGQITLQAGGNISAAPSRQYVTDWWWRQAGTSSNGQPAAWWSRYDLFAQGIASFGGGDITVRAGGNIADLELSTPSSGYAVQAGTAVNGAPLPGGALTLPGGQLQVSAGGDITSGLYFGGGAVAALRAGGSIRAAASTGLGSAHPGVQLFYQDTAWTLDALGDLRIGNLANPALLSGTVQGSGAARSDVITGLDNQASLAATSLTGTLWLSDTRTALAPSQDPRNTSSDIASQAPGRLALLAPSGAIKADAPLLQRPVGDGNLTLLAETDVSVSRIVVGAAPASAGVLPLARISADAGLVQQWPQTPDAVPTLDQSSRQAVQLVARSGDLALHADVQSARPLRAVAGHDLLGTGSAAITVQHQAVGELSLLQAGRDIVLPDNSAARLRVAGPGDVLLLAGRHVNLKSAAGITSVGNQDNPRLLPVGGASITVVSGVLWGAAGADYQQALAAGFQLAGAGAALVGYRAELWATTSALARGLPAPTAGSAALAQQAALFNALDAAGQRAAVITLLDEIGNTSGTPGGTPGINLGSTRYDSARAAAMRRFTGQPLSDSAALAEWAALDGARRSAQEAQVLAQLLAGALPADARQGLTRALLDAAGPERTALALHEALFDELRSAGRAAARLAAGPARDAAYQPGLQALAALYPTPVVAPDAVGSASRPVGNISLAASQIKTQQGGNIHLLAPGGAVDAGALTGSSGKKASELGLLTTAGGKIEAAVLGNFAVNQSRVFTLAQGDLLLWSSQGNIDAGKGARTVAGAPAPVTTIDANGNVVVDASGSFSGSGIAVLDAGSILDLYAPRGEISAGEAGIKPLGLAFLGANTVVGQIEGSGNTVGAPPPPPPAGATSGLATLGQASAAATSTASAERADDADRDKRKRRRNLLLEFLGFGRAE